MNEVMVSVLCTAYNHEKYIAQALESIVKQKTSFAFELIVHEDASTDGTAAIIRKYEELYPDIIVPIYQRENKYSQKVSIVRDIMFPKTRGKYFAICEGDDFWTDPGKLQKQFDYMQAHPECTLCIHNALLVDQEGRSIGSESPVSNSRSVSCEEVIRGGGEFCATNSIFAPTRFTHHFPDYYKILNLDLVWLMYFASQGETFCFAEEMSAYRIGVENSWTKRVWENPAKRIAWFGKLKDVYEAFDEETSKKYHSAVEDKIFMNEISRCVLQKNLKYLNGTRFEKRYRELPLKKKIHIWLQIHIPQIISAYETIRPGNR